MVRPTHSSEGPCSRSPARHALRWARPLCGAAAQDIDGLQANIDAAQQQAQGLAAQIDGNDAAIAAAQARAQAAAEHEAELSAVLAQSQQKEAELTQQVDAAAEQLQRSRADLQDALAALSDRLVAIYKGDMPDAATLLLSAQGFDDLATRAEYLERIETADSNLASRVRTLRDQVSAQLGALEEAKARVAAFNDQLEQARAQIEQARAQAEAQAAEFAAARARQADALAEPALTGRRLDAAGPGGPAGLGGRRSTDRRRLVRRLGDPAGDRDVRVGRQLRRRQPVQRGRRRLPDPALDVGAYGGHGKPTTPRPRSRTRSHRRSGRTPAPAPGSARASCGAARLAYAVLLSCSLRWVDQGGDSKGRFRNGFMCSIGWGRVAPPLASAPR